LQKKNFDFSEVKPILSYISYEASKKEHFKRDYLLKQKKPKFETTRKRKTSNAIILVLGLLELKEPPRVKRVEI
jgi:hypothetical protein